jgi:hypothetical protein
MFKKKSADAETQTPVPPAKTLSVHTMKKDLADPSGTYAAKLPSGNNLPFPSQSASAGPASAQVKTDSPFLTAGWPNNNTGNRSEKTAGTVKNEIILKKKTGSKHIVSVIIILLILLLAGGGGYYFWTAKMAPPPKTAASQKQNSSPEPATLPAIATDKPNYLSIDLKNPDTEAIKKVLMDYANKVTQSKTAAPVAFIVTDPQNNPVSFQDFGKAAGLTLPPKLLAQLGPGFTLYMYNDAGHTRIGLAVAEKSDVQLTAALTQEEPNLIQDLKPLLLASSYTLNNNPFGNSDYNGVPIRFNNIISPDNLSLDYTIYQNQWLIGTTKLTLRSIIDLLNSQIGSSAGNVANSQ